MVASSTVTICVALPASGSEDSDATLTTTLVPSGDSDTLGTAPSTVLDQARDTDHAWLPSESSSDTRFVLSAMTTLVLLQRQGWPLVTD